MKRPSIALAIGTALVLSAIGTLETRAATITAYELIQDKDAGDDDVDLERVRFDGVNMPAVTVGSDSTIKLPAQNNVDGDFGRFDSDTVTYTHRLDWLTHGTLTGALLEITARSVDTLIADTVSIVLSGNNFSFLGNLTSGNGLSSFPVAVSYLTGDLLRIEIDKSNGSGSGRNRIDPDKIEIVSSKLSVTWETASSPLTSRVPDGGATLALLGFGLMGVAACSRKLASKKN